MSITLNIDVHVMDEQITLLRGTLSNKKLSARQRYLIVNLLSTLQTLKSDSGEEILDSRAA